MTAQSTIRGRTMRMLVAFVLVIAAMGIGMPPAKAATTYQCTGAASTGSVGVWTTGSTVRYTGGSTNSGIMWSFFTGTGCPNSFLPGQPTASLSMRVAFCSGSGGTSNGTTFTTVTAAMLATNVLPGTCFRVQWRPNNAATANKPFHGKIQWQIS